MLVAVVTWLVTKPVVRFSLGRAVSLVAEVGVPAFALQDAAGGWRLYAASARSADEGLRLPEGILGRPALHSDGSAFVLTEVGLSWVHATHPIVPGGEVVQLLGRDALPVGTRLEGVVAGKEPLLSVPAGEHRRLMLCQGGPLGSAHLTPISLSDGDALVPDGVPLIASRAVRALAFLGPAGWEAWSVQEGGLATRSLAEGCTRPGAIFSPDGDVLIVPGRVAGLWKLDLADGSLNLMAEGNPGVSRRVGQTFSFREVPDPAGGMQWVLLLPQWDLDRRLQIYQAHLSGGGRGGVTIGAVHHYGVSVSRDGRLLAYTQAVFEERGDDAFVEDLYLLDFDAQTSATMLESRRGGRSDQGPAFVGNGAALVYLADGAAVRIDVRKPPPEP